MTAYAAGRSTLGARRRWPLGKPHQAGPGHSTAVPGSSVYIIHASDSAVAVGERNLTSPLRDLVTTILAVGDPA